MRAHINPVSGPERCRAEKGNCPFGGDSGQTDHFDSIVKAKEVYQNRLVSAYGNTATLTSRVKKLSAQEADLLEAHKKALQEIVSLKAKIAEGEPNSTGADSKQLQEALDSAAAKQNTHLMEKLARAKTVLNSRIVSDKYADNINEAKDSLDDLEGRRASIQGEMIRVLRAYGTKDEKFQLKDSTGTFSAFVKDDFDQDAFDRLPKKVQDACLIEKDGFDVDLARKTLSPEVFDRVTNQTLVLDNVVKNVKERGGFAQGLPGDTIKEKMNSGLGQLSEVYQDFRDFNNGETVSETKTFLGEQKDQAKGIHESAHAGETVFYPHSNGGILIGARRTVNPQAIGELTPKQLAGIRVVRKTPDIQKAKSVLPPDTFKKVFEVPTISLRVTESKK